VLRYFPGETWLPVTPFRLWKSTYACPDYTSLPPDDVLIRFPRTAHGRVIKKTSPQLGCPADVYSMVSLRGDIFRIPPHPGIRPSELDEYIHPSYITSDASLGPYNPARYAQVFDHRRPWMGFHGFSQFAEHSTITTSSTVDFFDFSRVKEDEMTGGRWRGDMLRDVYLERDSAEDLFFKALADIGDPQGEKLLAHFGPALPFFDSTTFETTMYWKTWVDGRDLLGFTLRNIRELFALRRWLLELKRQANYPGDSSPSDPNLSGIWIGTVSSAHDWRFLMHSPLPLFGLFTVPRGHSLYNLAVPGGLDNDEFYRTDPVINYFQSIPTAYDEDYPLTTTTRTINVPLGTSKIYLPLPLSLTLLPPGETFEMDKSSGHLRTMYDLPFTTYLFDDEKIHRKSHSEIPSIRGRYLRDRVDAIISATKKEHLPPVLEMNVPFTPLPLHPITTVLPPRQPRDREQRRFRENHISSYFWPDLISKDQSETSNPAVCRYIHDLGNNDLLESNWPWPCVAEVEANQGGMIDETHGTPSYFNPEKHRRRYVCREPSKTILNMLYPPESDPKETIWSHIIDPSAGPHPDAVVIGIDSSANFIKACRSGPDDDSGNTPSPLVCAALQILGADEADLSVRIQTSVRSLSILRSLIYVY
jgi:hypothetical protein